MGDEVIVVTGAFGVLGRATALLAASRGGKVAHIDCASRPPKLTAAEAIIFDNVDLTSVDAATHTMANVHKSAGRIDALINIAGGFVWQTLADGDHEQWKRMYSMNLLTAANASRAALPYLSQTRGSIVNVGAAAAHAGPGAGMGAYAASKAGVHMLTESLAAECLGMIRVNAVLPTVIDTPQNRADMPDADTAKWVSPENLAKTILFLASDEAADITGALLPVRGRL